MNNIEKYVSTSIDISEDLFPDAKIYNEISKKMVYDEFKLWESVSKVIESFKTNIESVSNLNFADLKEQIEEKSIESSHEFVTIPKDVLEKYNELVNKIWFNNMWQFLEYATMLNDNFENDEQFYLIDLQVDIEDYKYVVKIANEISKNIKWFDVSEVLNLLIIRYCNKIMDSFQKSTENVLFFVKLEILLKINNEDDFVKNFTEIMLNIKTEIFKDNDSYYYRYLLNILTSYKQWNHTFQEFRKTILEVTSTYERVQSRIDSLIFDSWKTNEFDNKNSRDFENINFEINEELNIFLSEVMNKLWKTDLNLLLKYAIAEAKIESHIISF